MEWDSGPHAGFSTAAPWLAVAEGWQARNVASQGEFSHLAFYRRMLALRKVTPALKMGAYRSLDGPDDCFVFERSDSVERYVVALNFGGTDRRIEIPGTVVLSTRLDMEGPVDHLDVRPHEGVVVRL